jgi:hypothetical protein
MPESITATPMPWPVRDLPAASLLAHTEGAPTAFVTSCRLVSVESTSQRFWASGAVVAVTTVEPVVLVVVVLVVVPELVVVVVVVVPLLVVVELTVVVLVAASAGAAVRAAAVAPASVAERTPAGHLPPRGDRCLDLVLISSPYSPRRGAERRHGGP